MQATQAIIGLPVHSFRLVRERLTQVCTTAQPPPDLFRLPNPSMHRCLLLACIGKVIALAASKQFTCAVEHRGPASAVAAVAINRTNEPRSLTTEMAGCPSDRHPLLD